MLIKRIQEEKEKKWTVFKISTQLWRWLDGCTKLPFSKYTICDSNQRMSYLIKCPLPSGWKVTVRWVREEDLSVRRRAQTQQLSNQPMGYHNYLLLCIPQLPALALFQLQTARFILIHTMLSSAIGRVNRNCCLFPTPPLSSYLISNASFLFQPLTCWHTSSSSKEGGKVDTVSSWYTVLHNWQEITVSRAAHHTTLHNNRWVSTKLKLYKSQSV